MPINHVINRLGIINQQLQSLKSSQNQIPMSNKKLSNCKEYMRVPHNTRKELIKQVLQQNLSIKTASENLNINYSTAKLIIKKYKKLGYITKFSDEFVQSLKETEERMIQNSEQDKQAQQNNIQNMEYVANSYKQQQNVLYPVYFWVPSQIFSLQTATCYRQPFQSPFMQNNQLNSAIVFWNL